MRFLPYQEVYVARLGPSYGDQKFRGRIVGKVGSGDPGYGETIWVVHMIDPIPGNDFFPCFCVTGSCVDAIDDEQNGSNPSGRMGDAPALSFVRYDAEGPQRGIPIDLCAGSMSDVTRRSVS